MRIKRLMKLLLPLCGLMAAGQAAAVTFNVSKTTDTNDGVCDSDCSLREAVIAANSTPGTDTILLSMGDYQLTLLGTLEDAAQTGDLDITDSVVIQGAGHQQSTVNGMGEDKVFHVLETTAPVSLSLFQLTVRNGRNTSSLGAGVAFFSSGLLHLEDTMFTKNHSDGYGGAVELRGTATGQPKLIASHSVFTENCSTSGAAIDGDGTWTISHSKFTKNGGWFVPDQGAAFDCKVDQWGGALYLNRAFARIANSSFQDNQAIGGGAIHTYCCDLYIENSTFTGNHAYSSTGFNGGAIELFGPAQIIIDNSTFAYNSSNNMGGGIANDTSNLISLGNSILYNNSAMMGGDDCYGSITSQGSNIVGTDVGCGYIAQVSDLISVDPLLGAFMDNGHPGSGYYPVVTGSPAIDAVNNCYVTVDQRGVTRPADGDFMPLNNCDIGAYELDPAITKIVANGVTGTLTINSSDLLNIDISLDTVEQTDEEAEWWLQADTPMGPYYYNAGLGGWQPGSAMSHQAPLFDIAGFTALSMSGLPAGTYKFHFQVDTQLNGTPDSAWIASVNVDILP